MSNADFETVSVVVDDEFDSELIPRRLNSVSDLIPPTLPSNVVVPRIWIGLWQLSSPAWGTAPVSKIRAEMNRHFLRGFTTFADHYGSAEILFGKFRQSLAQNQPPLPTLPLCATKWCIFRALPVPYTRKIVEEAVRERMARTLSDSIDILQIHWQAYDDPSYLAVFRHLVDIKRQGQLPIGALGLVNFDTRRVDEICTTVGTGEIVSNQVQFSLIDVRPLYGMAEICLKHGVKLLTYGTLCGGFLSDKWLDQPQPDAYRDAITPSQRKYLDVILNAWGGWDLFQSLLSVLRMIGDRHGGLSIANVATRWVLDQPFVAAVIVGARLGVAEHRDDNARVFSFRLNQDDMKSISAVLARSNGRFLIRTMGDCGAEYR
ncbi:hypothetical protein BS47DRAFT_1373008 [Hydnum rufescens UP504]|uniref:NADP-dependent oxidoreductase domain-containing protein n=1 Tax=Hydnum rufescens UP504 TaxID=1448309 RepID=A0A9P6ATM8_9AGAM|nr:hypothetical protein BS47DRAFT_1373008 [Hydnum rufescens UP504]